ncbi:MAG: 16S rRNA (adenine(1518)-N(6)/adenine(1519)-N(6))-dimethyltransferase RsmA [Promethearchaeota archaeon]
MNFKDVQLILNQMDFKPKKYLGQNFLINKKIAEKIIDTSDISKTDIVLEVGPGIGALTELLVKKAKMVYAVEIDSVLCKFLSQKFSIYNNIEIINDDILKFESPSHNKLVSNIPYKITGSILEKIFFKENPPQGILTIERSLADRIFLSGTYKNLSRISISLNAFMNPILKYSIPRNSFYPIPKIDISLIKIIPKENLNPYLLEKESASSFLKFVAGIMPYKNKNILNALYLFFKAKNSPNYTKRRIQEILNKNNFEDKKLFKLNTEEFIELSRIIYS